MNGHNTSFMAWIYFLVGVLHIIAAILKHLQVH